MKYGCWSFASGDGSGGGANGRATSLCPSGPGSNPVNLNSLVVRLFLKERVIEWCTLFRLGKCATFGEKSGREGKTLKRFVAVNMRLFQF